MDCNTAPFRVSNRVLRRYDRITSSGKVVEAADYTVLSCEMQAFRNANPELRHELSREAFDTCYHGLMMIEDMKASGFVGQS